MTVNNLQKNITNEVKQEAVRKFLNRGTRSVLSIAEEFGTQPSNLYKWTKKFDINNSMKNNSSKRPQERSNLNKFNLILEYSHTPDSSKGEFLRQNGIKLEHIEEWRKQSEAGLASATTKSQERQELAAERRKVKDLEKELSRKDKALAEATALLILKKKADLIWGISEDE